MIVIQIFETMQRIMLYLYIALIYKMDKIAKGKLEHRYHLIHKIKYSIDSHRVNYAISNCLKRLDPVNSSLNTSAINSNLDKAQEDITLKNHHFDRSIELELSKLHNKFFADPLSKRSLVTVTSLTPAPDLLINPLKQGVTNMQNSRIFRSFDRQKPKALQIDYPKSISIHLDPNFKFQKIRKPIKSTDMSKIDKVISDCNLEQGEKKKNLKYLENWVGANTFDNDRTYEKQLTKRLFEEDNVHSQISVPGRNNKKLWKQNRYGFIAQVDRELYSVRKIL